MAGGVGEEDEVEEEDGSFSFSTGRRTPRGLMVKSPGLVCNLISFLFSEEVAVVDGVEEDGVDEGLVEDEGAVKGVDDEGFEAEVERGLEGVGVGLGSSFEDVSAAAFSRSASDADN